jgi:predicted ATPase
LAERIFEDAPQVYILATSRETLRVEGEHVHRLAPLNSPPDELGLTAVQALAFPSAQLFVERVISGGCHYELNDADAPVVSELCRRLDGIPLAIELAAGRVCACSGQEISDLVYDRFKLLWEGRRTALPRHRTLAATLDWSYDLLSESERIVARRLSVFSGSFTRDSARSVAADKDIDDTQISSLLTSLIAKSFISATTIEGITSYRLLNTLRAYLADKLTQSAESVLIKRRHAALHRAFLKRVGVNHSVYTSAPSSRAEHLGNVRAALESRRVQPLPRHVSPQIAHCRS